MPLVPSDSHGYGRLTLRRNGAYGTSKVVPVNDTACGLCAAESATESKPVNVFLIGTLFAGPSK